MARGRSKNKRKGGGQMINWWMFVAGLVGVVGVIGQMPSEWGHWLVGVAFLAMFVSSFFEK